jgi:Zn-dependent protease
MLGQAGHTEFDVRFDLMGIPVRIHPIFWLSSAWLVWDGDNPASVFIGVLCVLFSVLVHELGHAVMCRRYGFPSEIVLYFLGGYATSTSFSTWKNVKVSVAGPAAGLAFFGLSYATLVGLQDYRPELLAPGEIASTALLWLLFMNLMWSVINLIPTLPLDGGRIMQVLMLRYSPRGAELRIVQASIAAAGGVALWSLFCMNNRQYNVIPIPQALLTRINVSAIQPDARFMLIFFGFLCAQQIMTYNEMKGRH